MEERATSLQSYFPIKYTVVKNQQVDSRRRVIRSVVLLLVYHTLTDYSRFQVTFQSAVPKFVLNIPNYITKFGIYCVEFAKPNLHVAD